MASGRQMKHFTPYYVLLLHCIVGLHILNLNVRDNNDDV